MKRAHEDSKVPAWKLTFEEGASLRTMVDSASTVITNPVFRVSRHDGEWYLSVFGSDVGYTCVVDARIKADIVEGVSESTDTTFCLNAHHLASVLDVPSMAGLPLVIEGYSDCTVLVKMVDVEKHTHEAASELPTFEHEPMTQPMEFNMDLKMELHTATLREVIKKATKAHSEHVMFAVYYKDVGTDVLSIVELHIDGDYKHTQRFCHRTPRLSDGSRIVKAVPDSSNTNVSCLDTGEPRFRGTFPVDKLNAFVKNVQDAAVIANIQEDPNMPLLLTTYLQGGTDAHVRFCIAPKVEGM